MTEHDRSTDKMDIKLLESSGLAGKQDSPASGEMTRLIAELDALAEKATPGFWYHYRRNCADADAAKAELSAMVDVTLVLTDDFNMHGVAVGGHHDPDADYKVTAVTGCGSTSPQNAQFIAALRNAYPKLREAAAALEGVEQQRVVDSSSTLSEFPDRALGDGGTPRTDAVVLDVWWNIDDQAYCGIIEGDYVTAAFARTLERELIAAERERDEAKRETEAIRALMNCRP